MGFVQYKLHIIAKKINSVKKDKFVSQERNGIQEENESTNKWEFEEMLNTVQFWASRVIENLGLIPNGICFRFWLYLVILSIGKVTQILGRY